MNTIDDVLTALRRIIRATDLYSKHLEKTAGLTAPQLMLIELVNSQANATSGVLAKQMNLSQATVTTILDRLELRGIVVRERSITDKRKVYVSLSKEGTAIFSRAPVPLQHYFAQQFQALEGWEQTMIVSALQRIACMMNAQDLDASPVLDVGALDRDSVTITKAPKNTKARRR